MAKTNKIINLQLEKLYVSGYIDLAKFPQENIREFYIEKQSNPYNKSDYTVIDCSRYKRKIKEEVIDYLFYLFSSSKNFSRNTHAVYIIPLIKALIALDCDCESLTCALDSLNLNMALYNNLKMFLDKRYDKSNGFDIDIWDLGEFNLAEARKNPTSPIYTLNFSKIENTENKILVKKYIKYLITNTNFTIGNVRKGLIRLQCCVMKFCDKKIVDIKRVDILNLYNWLDESKNLNNRSFNEFIRALDSFFQYLCGHETICNNPIHKEDYRNEIKKKKYSAIDPYVSNQIFNILNEIDEKLALMFMLLFCVGMRNSELCQIPIKNCIEATEFGCFIRYYSQKMQKFVQNVIPEELYNRIDNYKFEKTNHNLYCKYLFESGKGTAYRTKTFSNQINKIMIKYQIKNPDGTQYHFEAHDYRHTMATRMSAMEIPFQYIQEQLHHEGPEMTMAYIEFSDERKRKSFNNFINNVGEPSPFEIPPYIDAEDAKVEWLREKINVQILPNGVCAHPTKLGKCPHANNCLTCSEFRTSISDLSTHKLQLANIEEYIKIAEINGWKMQVESNKNVKQTLLKIIDKLEALAKEGE